MVAASVGAVLGMAVVVVAVAIWRPLVLRLENAAKEAHAFLSTVTLVYYYGGPQ